MIRLPWLVLLVVALAAVPLRGCRRDASTGPEDGSADGSGASDGGLRDAAPDATADGTLVGPEQRPVSLYLPADHDPARPHPLVLLLHPWMSDSYGVDDYLRRALGYHALVDEAGFVLAVPRGTAGGGQRHWNATPACCAGPDNDEVDDVGYLAGLIGSIGADHGIDPRRVYIVGHSNGGFMAHRMACERADLIAAVVSLAGATFADPSRCEPSEPVSVLQLHGDADHLVGYDGGRLDEGWPDFPGAMSTVEQWAALDGCSTARPVIYVPKVDLDGNVPGAETYRERFEGCPNGIDVALWTIEHGSHNPDLSSGTFARVTWTWLSDHAKP